MLSHNRQGETVFRGVPWTSEIKDCSCAKRETDIVEPTRNGYGFNCMLPFSYENLCCFPNALSLRFAEVLLFIVDDQWKSDLWMFFKPL